MRSATLLTAAALLASSVAGASHGHARKRDLHSRHVKRSDPRVNEERDYDVTYANGTSSHELAKRQSYTGRGTFYYTGLGACGIYNSDSDFIVALNTPQYNEYGGGYPGPQCWKWITVQANGITVSGIQITDECPTCDWGSLDMSPGLFTQFAAESVGVLSITWWFDGQGGQQSTSSTQQWTPTTSSTWQAPSTTSSSSQWTPTTTSWSQTSTTSWSSSTTSWSAPPSSNTTTWSSTTVTTSSNPFIVAQSVNSTMTSATATNTAANASTTDANGNTVSSTPSEAQSAGNLEAINGLVTNYGQIVVAAAGGKSS